MRYDLTDLRLFVNIVDAGSLTAGAARSHLALASASARIAGLESALDVRLLERGRRGTRPTAAGLALARHARAMLQLAGRLNADLAEYAQGLRGQVRLMSNTAALTGFLPEALARFLRQHPDIDVETEERPSVHIVRAVADGTADLGIVSDAVDTGDLECLPVAHDRLVLCLPRGHRLAGLSSLTLEAALDEEFIMLALQSALALYLEGQAARLARRLRVRLRLPDFDAVLRAVAGGCGVAIVPHAAAARLRHPGTKLVALSDPWASRRLLLCMRDAANLPRHAGLLARLLAAAGGTAPPAGADARSGRGTAPMKH